MVSCSLEKHDRSAVGLVLATAVGLLLLIGLSVTPARADRTVSVQPPSTTAYVDDTFTLTMNVDDATGVAGFQFDISYDGSLFAFTPPARAGTLLTGLGWVIASNQIDPDTLRVLGYSPTATPLAGGSGALLALDFLAATPGTTSVSLPSVLLGDTVGDPIAAAGVGGSVTIVLCSAPVATFSGTPTSGCAPVEVCFTDTSTGTPTSWSWTFGDGGTSTQQNPCHTYNTPGSYAVSLNVTNGCGSDSETKSGYVSVGGPPTAAFSGTPTSGCAPLEVCFTDASTGSPTSWSWTFGDGGTSTLQDPCHTYTSPGSYGVSLTVQNGCSSDAETKSGYVTVPVPPTAAFSGTPTSGSAPLEVCFTDESAGDPTSWSWTFGDDAASTVQDPCHTYAKPGFYTPGLTVQSACGSDAKTKADYIVAEFPDISSEHWAYDWIMACLKAGIVGGYWDNTYRPTLEVNRAQMAVYIARGVAGGDDQIPPCPPTATFPDVQPDSSWGWACKYVEYVADLCIVGGYWDGTYRPELVVDRAQMAVFMCRAKLAKELGDACDDLPDPGCETPTFPDVPCDHWARKYVEYCAAEGIVTGYWDGTYRPEVPVTRDQMAVFIARAFELPI